MHVADHLTLEQLRERADAEHDERIFVRLRAVLLAAQGCTAPEIVAALGGSRRAVRLGRPLQRRGTRRPGGSPTPRPALVPARRRHRPPPPADRRRADPGRRRLHPPGRGGPLDPPGRVRRPLQHLRPLRPAAPARLLLPRPQAPPPQGRPGRAGGVQKKVGGLIDDVARAHPGKRVEVWFEDEARFGQKGTLTTVWAARGSRPTAVRQTQYDNLWVIAAACPATGAAAGIIMPHLNTDVINLFLDEFSRQLAPRRPGRADLGRGGLPHRRGAGGAGERAADPAAAVLAGAEPDREPLALPPLALLVESRLRGLGGPEGARRSPGWWPWGRSQSGSSRYVPPRAPDGLGMAPLTY